MVGIGQKSLSISTKHITHLFIAWFEQTKGVLGILYLYTVYVCEIPRAPYGRFWLTQFSLPNLHAIMGGEWVPLTSKRGMSQQLFHLALYWAVSFPFLFFRIWQTILTHPAVGAVAPNPGQPGQAGLWASDTSRSRQSGPWPTPGWPGGDTDRKTRTQKNCLFGPSSISWSKWQFLMLR